MPLRYNFFVAYATAKITQDERGVENVSGGKNERSEAKRIEGSHETANRDEQQRKIKLT